MRSIPPSTAARHAVINDARTWISAWERREEAYTAIGDADDDDKAVANSEPYSYLASARSVTLLDQCITLLYYLCLLRRPTSQPKRFLSELIDQSPANNTNIASFVQSKLSELQDKETQSRVLDKLPPEMLNIRAAKQLVQMQRHNKNRSLRRRKGHLRFLDGAWGGAGHHQTACAILTRLGSTVYRDVLADLWRPGGELYEAACQSSDGRLTKAKAMQDSNAIKMRVVPPQSIAAGETPGRFFPSGNELGSSIDASLEPHSPDVSERLLQSDDDILERCNKSSGADSEGIPENLDLDVASDDVGRLDFESKIRTHDASLLGSFVAQSSLTPTAKILAPLWFTNRSDNKRTRLPRCVGEGDVYVPLHPPSTSHWSLAVLSQSRNALDHYDSQRSTHRDNAVMASFQIFWDELKPATESHIRIMPHCPQQADGVSCGVLVSDVAKQGATLVAENRLHGLTAPVQAKQGIQTARARDNTTLHQATEDIRVDTHKYDEARHREASLEAQLAAFEARGRVIDSLGMAFNHVQAVQGEVEQSLTQQEPNRTPSRPVNLSRNNGTNIFDTP
ncbi:hypothetical protein G7046_g9956 [Stylonectria norvegica]|nr:hypothetical protein G7046_g9956 [Stylonectria norvegica]